MTKLFRPEHFPSISELIKYDENIENKLPKEYRGSNESVYYAQIFAKNISIINFNDPKNDDIPSDMNKGKPYQYFLQNHILNSGIASSIYWGFNNYIEQFDVTNDEKIGYILYLSHQVPSHKLAGTLSLLKEVSKNPILTKHFTEFHTLEEIDNYNIFSKKLRDEGVNSPPSLMWHFAKEWDFESLVYITKKGYTFSDIDDFINVGYTTKQEIMENYIDKGLRIPASWIKKIKEMNNR